MRSARTSCFTAAAALMVAADNRRVRIEGELTRRTHLDTYTSENVLLFGGPTGIPGHADRTDSGRETTDWTVGINLIGRTGWRRVSLFGGPGAVFHRKELRHVRSPRASAVAGRRVNRQAGDRPGEHLRREARH